MTGYTAIALRLGHVGWWVLSAQGSPEDLDPDGAAFPFVREGVKGYAAADSGGERPLIELADDDDGLLIRLLETRQYEWEVIGCGEAEVFSSLESLPRRQWRRRRVKHVAGSFAVINHLGMADFRVVAGEIEWRFGLEIVSGKLDYHTEFRAITEDIGAFCQQLLLEWEGPTSLRFGGNMEEQGRLVLEKFLFVRAHVDPVRLGEWFEAIQRRPHAKLVRESEWSPVAAAGSVDWLGDPVGMARDWRRVGGGGGLMPGQVRDVRKEDSVDTEANRFLKFALGEFRELCREVMERHGGAYSLVREARELAVGLDAVLARPFFRQVGQLRRLPMDNPTLQRRDGYREVLRAWVLSQAAVMLAWDRGLDGYGGPTRNVATLYEYWVFLQLHGILDEMEEVVRDGECPRPAADADPFLEIRDGMVHLHLKRGRKTCAPFVVRLGTGQRLRVHLYYERVFQWDRSAGAAAGSASYSRQFKPDYTLVMFPAECRDEEEAAGQGRVAYLHFDAKYRAEHLAMIFGGEGEELDEEKDEAKAVGTYKRGDLLKMHAYNDAVRQTAGSYVLYPGSDRETRLSKFHEILPGVGAFVLKPGRPDGRDALRHFLRDVFRHQADQFTQYRHISDVSHATVRQQPVQYGDGWSHRPGATCLLVYVPGEKEEVFRSAQLVYCHALRDDAEQSPVRLRLGSLEGAVLCGYRGGRASERVSLSWVAPVVSCEMLSRKALGGLLRQEGWTEDQMPSRASAYLLFRLGSSSALTPRVVSGLTPTGSYEAVSCTMGDLLACGAGGE
ncbi:MAG: hypothetical protein RLZZ179_299 [Verrucomicrobiota bacterium]|jgi:predicted component of viral defense system (DUF524 family)